MSKVHLPTSVAKLGDETPLAPGVVYRRTDLNGNIDPYVGQSKSLDRYEIRQYEHARAHPDALFDYEVIDRGHPGVDLDRKEEFHIRNEGGPTNKSNPDGLLSNRRHQMSNKRYIAAGGDPY